MTKKKSSEISADENQEILQEIFFKNFPQSPKIFRK